MNLQEYLKANDYSLSRAARTLKISRQHLQQICRKKSYASYYLAIAIEKLTKGEFKKETLMKPRKPNE